MAKFKYILTAIILLCSFISFAQPAQYTPMTASGYQMKRLKVDSTLHLPSFCGVPTLRGSVVKEGALAIDTCGALLYMWTGAGGWDTINVSGGGSSTDTTSLSNRINLKLNISDTASMLSPYLRKIDTVNKFVNSITRTLGKDSIIYFIGGTRYAIKDSVGNGGGSSQNGRFGNDTALVVMAKVHNNAGVTLTNGKVVAFSTSGTSSDAPSVKLANNKADSTSATTFGFVSGTIAVNDTGWVILSGKIEKLNTSAFSNGDIIYLDSISGQYTNSKPQAPYHLVYLGTIVKANAGNGAIYVKVQNGYELSEIHDVKINGVVNNQIIAYSDTQKLWKNRNIYSIVDTTNTIATKSNVALKLNISDTSSMLSSYSTRINGKLNIGDTASMLSSYSTRINGKLNISDTSSMLSSYSTRINGKLNITDTSTLQRKSIPAYSILANNTSATANVTAQQFRDTSGTYSGTITWTGTTAPSGATTHTYRLTQVGKCVTLHIALVYATNGAGLTAVQMTLPSGAPTPAQPTGLTGSIFNMYPVKVEIVNSLNQVILGSSARGFIRNNTGATGYEIYVTFSTAAPGQVGVIAQYWTN